MKRGSLIFLLIVAAIGLLAVVKASLLHGGLSARATPGRLEIFFARNVRHLAIPASAREMWNPIVNSPAVQQEARRHFADHCATCHANDGSGESEIGRGLYPKPPDLRAAATQKLSDGEIFWIIQNGVRFTGMPAFGSDPDHSDPADTWKLVRFIRHLPQLTPEEKRDMENFNPKAPDDQPETKEQIDLLNGTPLQTKKAVPHHHH
jgi:mono/diheme cytochrome c family protein